MKQDALVHVASVCKLYKIQIDEGRKLDTGIRIVTGMRWPDGRLGNRRGANIKHME